MGKKVRSNNIKAKASNEIFCESLRPFVKSRKKIWVENGLFFGYPKCCIIDFCERDFNMTIEQEQVHQNTGFVPCPKCSKKIISGQETLKSLIKNRFCKKPFSKHV